MRQRLEQVREIQWNLYMVQLIESVYIYFFDYKIFFTEKRCFSPFEFNMKVYYG